MATKILLKNVAKMAAKILLKKFAKMANNVAKKMLQKWQQKNVAKYFGGPFFVATGGQG